MIDTHSHIYLQDFDEDREEVLARAMNNGVQKVLLPNIDTESVSALLSTHSHFPEHTAIMMGLHPGSVREDFTRQLEDIRNSFNRLSITGIGEIGMDLYWDKSFAEQQKEALRIQLNWAIELSLPVSLHTRSALKETLDIIDEFPPNSLTGVFHCFTENLDMAREIISRGFKLGIGGVVTFKNSRLSDVLSHIPLEHIVLETDAPYLAPHPKRGKRNEPVMLTYIRNMLANVYGVSPGIIDSQTTKTAKDTFRLHMA